jgi:predicted ATPase
MSALQRSCALDQTQRVFQCQMASPEQKCESPSILYQDTDSIFSRDEHLHCLFACKMYEEHYKQLANATQKQINTEKSRAVLREMYEEHQKQLATVAQSKSDNDEGPVVFIDDCAILTPSQKEKLYKKGAYVNNPYIHARLQESCVERFDSVDTRLKKLAYNIGIHKYNDCLGEYPQKELERLAAVLYPSKWRTCWTCSQAGNNSEILLCGNCREIAYCSKTCQKNDWKRHKQSCVPAHPVKVVFSGAPGCGKTSTLKALSHALDCALVPEVWTSLRELAIANATLDSFDQKTRDVAFYLEMCATQCGFEDKTAPAKNKKITLLDRSMLDVLAFAEYYKVPLPSERVSQFISKCEYASTVVFLAPLPESMYTKQDFCSYDESLRIHAFLRDFYQSHGYHVVQIPFCEDQTKLLCAYFE